MKAVIFAILCLAAWMAPGLFVGTANALLGGALNGPAGRVAYVAYAVSALLLLLGITWRSLRRDGESLRDLGLTLDIRRLREFAFGVAVTAVLFAGCALVRAAWVGASWRFEGTAGLGAALVALPIAFLLMAPEELVFRGYGFRQLTAAYGPRVTIAVSALAFGVYHLAQTGFGMWGIGAFWVVALPALGGIVFGMAMVQTNGLALPLGLHLGGNWVQASVFRLGGPTDGAATALFTAPVTSAQAQILWSPDPLPHVPYLVMMAGAAILVARWRTSARADRLGAATTS